MILHDNLYSGGLTEFDPFDLGNDRLSGLTLDAWGAMSKLREQRPERNQLSGQLPADLRWLTGSRGWLPDNDR